MNLLFFLTLAASWIVQIFGLPTGAPSTACVSMYPQHPGPNGPVSAQTGTSVPFQIQVAPAQMNGAAYKITVLRNPNFPGAPPPLAGFFLQVRDPNGGDQPLGEFVNLPSYARNGDCGGSNAITHNNNAPKQFIDGPGLEFYWNPTGVQAGRNLQVLGTFVANLQTFWVKVPSQIFAVANEESAPQTPSNIPVAVVETGVPSSTDMPMPVNANNLNDNGGSVNVNNNDRQPGFGNNAHPAVTVSGPIVVHQTGNGAGKIILSAVSLFSGVILALL